MPCDRPANSEALGNRLQRLEVARIIGAASHVPVNLRSALCQQRKGFENHPVVLDRMNARDGQTRWRPREFLYKRATRLDMLTTDRDQSFVNSHQVRELTGYQVTPGDPMIGSSTQQFKFTDGEVSEARIGV
jgi:hypothetical protein